MYNKNLIVRLIALFLLMFFSFNNYAIAARKSEKKSPEPKAEKEVLVGYPVIGPLNDTIFSLYTYLGSYSPSDRAEKISQRIEKLYDDDLFDPESLQITVNENRYDITYGDNMIVMSIIKEEAKAHEVEIEEFANFTLSKIKTSIIDAKDKMSLKNNLLRALLVLVVIAILVGLFKGLQYGHNKLTSVFQDNQKGWFRSYSYKNYTFISGEQSLSIALLLLKLIKWITFLFLVYISLPIIFSIFPFSKDWANVLFQWILSPIKTIFTSVWEFIPDLITIIVIIAVMNYILKFIKYIFNEITSERLTIEGFHADWAIPTYTIIRIVFIAFSLVLIFPYLPFSDSSVFQGVSVFLGLLFSLGSSTAIANMVAGIVITYMRPFKIGDRIKAGDITGDVIEKSMLVTRIKTIKNEIITIPNATILNNSTTNYSSLVKEEGLIVYSTVTIGYDVPWRDVHKALIDSATKTKFIETTPVPFVLQTSLDDFYVSYQINAYTKEPSKVGSIYSELHQNIQDIFAERDIEIMSPHYGARRDGNMSTIPKIK